MPKTKPIKTKPIKAKAVYETAVTTYGPTSFGFGPCQYGTPIEDSGGFSKLIIVGFNDLERRFLGVMNPKITGQKVRITIEEI